MIQRLREQFRAEAPQEGAALAVAIEAGDFNAIYVRAHHLMDSAAVVRDDALFKACARVESAARNRDSEELTKAWAACVAALEPWKNTVIKKT